MGARKRLMADRIKLDRKSRTIARLKNCPTSPRKMRIVADLIRNKEVNVALNILKFTKKHASIDLEKLLLLAINIWEVKNEGVDIADAKLVIKSIVVESASMLKRLRPAPQGRGHRIRKRSNNVVLELVDINKAENNKVEQKEEGEVEVIDDSKPKQ